MKGIDQIISTRRTVRHFDPNKLVTRETLLPLLEAARLAPSAKNIQPLRYIVVLDPQEREKLHAVSQQPWFYSAPSYIVIVADHDAAWQRPQCDISYVDAAIALTHMLFKAEDLGLGATTVAAFDQDICRQLLSIPEHEEPVLILAVGHPDPAFEGREGNPKRKALEDLVSYIG